MTRSRIEQRRLDVRAFLMAHEAPFTAACERIVALEEELREMQQKLLKAQRQADKEAPAAFVPRRRII